MDAARVRGEGGFIVVALALGGVVLLAIILAAFAALFAASPALSSPDGPCSTGGPAGEDDPIDLPALEIATRISLVGAEMEMGEREILTAFTVALVESGGGVTMVNVNGGDATSTGVFQQQAFPEWTVGADGEERNRDNVADAARTFFERLPHYDQGQSIGELAADIQRPREDLRWKYAAALPRARYFFARVRAELAGGDGALLESLAPAPGCWAGSGPANLSSGETVYEPRQLVAIPPSYTGGRQVQIDRRVLANVIFMAEHYDLTITQGLGHAGTGSPSVSHNYGTAVDMVPAGSQAVAEWQRTAERLARDLGWTPECGFSGSRGPCALAPAIRFIGYNGFSDGNHGDPAHTGNPHIHISWECACGPYDGVFHGLSSWVKVFPPESEGGSAVDDRGSADTLRQ